MIAIYKYLNGDSNNGRQLFSLRSLKTHGHSMKLDERQFNLKWLRFFFTVRAVRMWNSLPQAVVSAIVSKNY